MGLTIFTKAAGSVASFVDPTLPGFVSLKMDGWGGFQGFKSILTRVAVSGQGNAQFSHSFGKSIYVYVFGDRIGQLGVSGLSFEQSCEGGGGLTGFEHVLNYYEQNRIAERQTPVRVTIGTSRTFSGYLMSFSGDMVDPKSRIYQFNMQFSFAPGKKARGGGGGAGSSAAAASVAATAAASGSSSPATFPAPTTAGADGSPAASRAVAAGGGWAASGTGPTTKLF